MDNLKQLIQEVGDQAFRLRNAKANGIMVKQETERMKNVLLNNLDAIIEALRCAEEAGEQINILNVQLDDAEEDLKKAEAELKALKEGKPAKGKKPDAEHVEPSEQ